jgi:environmental stress-induced protein Ves
VTQAGIGNSIVRETALFAVPWDNRGGVTRVIAERPGWRLSLATIAAKGPFSLFPGLVRHFALVAGTVELRRADGGLLPADGTLLARLDAQAPPLTFAGDDAVHADPGDAPALALNLMVPAAAPRLRLERWQAGHVPDALAVFACAAICANGAALAAHDTLFPAGAVALSGPALVVR